MMVRELPKEELKAFVIKYDYDDCTGFGAIIVHAYSIDEAISIFKKYMFEKKDDKWYEMTYRRSDFRYVSKNIFGWNQYFNDNATVCLKVREINTKCGDIIPIQEYFEDSKIEHMM